MVFNTQELKKIIQAPISIDMKIDLIEQLHHLDIQQAVNDKRQSILARIEKILSSERAESSTMIEHLEQGYVDQLLPDALAFAKKQKLTIPYLQRTFCIGYSRASRLLTQCEQVLNEVKD